MKTHWNIQNSKRLRMKCDISKLHAHECINTWTHTFTCQCMYDIDSVIQLWWGNKRKAGKMLLFPKTRKVYDKYEIKLLLCILVFQKCHISGRNVLCSSHNVMQTLKKKAIIAGWISWKLYCKPAALKTRMVCLII